jgi:hypothetical protein
MKFDRCTCVIDRAAHLKIEKTVPAWEVRVLKAVFGGDNVSISKTEAVDEDFDAREEWNSMFNRYKTAQDENAKSVFLEVYPNVDALEFSVERSGSKRTTEKRAAVSA